MYRDNHAPAGGRGVVFVGGPNSAAYARGRGAAAGRGSGAAPSGPTGSAYNAWRENGIAAPGDKAVQGPPQVACCSQPSRDLLCASQIILVTPDCMQQTLRSMNSEIATSMLKDVILLLKHLAAPAQASAAHLPAQVASLPALCIVNNLCLQ